MLHKTRYEGVYYRINRRGLKVFEARFKVDKKEYRRKIGEEPQYNAKSASQKRYEMIDEVKNGINTNKQTMDLVFRRYIELRKPMLSKSWAYNMEKTYNKHLTDIIGKYPPDLISSNDIQIRMNKMLEEGYAVSTVKQLKDCISGIYKYMLPDKDNIARKLIIPKFDNKIYFDISDDSARKLYDTIVTYPDIKWRIYFSFLLHGRRKMEVATLKYENLRLDESIYIIEPDNNKTKTQIIAPILPFLADMLKDYSNGSGYLFKGKNGGHVSSGGIDFQWRNIRSLAGLPKMRLHDLRHMIGFLAVKDGFSLEQIGKILNHTSSITTKRYSNIGIETAKNTLMAIHEKLQ